MITQFARRFTTLFLLVLILVSALEARSDEKPLIFPLPQKMQVTGGEFVFTESTSIIVPARQSKSESFLTGLVVSELVDRYSFAVKVAKRAMVKENESFILIGTLDNPLVKHYCDAHGLRSELKNLGDEGYILHATGSSVVIVGNKEPGVMYGIESFRQLIRREGGNIRLPQLTVTDKPILPYRGIKLYVPGRNNIPFFKRFIRDFAAKFKYNKIILELNANMRLDRHPELNAGTVDFAKAMLYSRLSDPHGRNNISKNSTHWDNADGGILEKAEVADLVSYMREFHFEVIPELPSLTHCYYLLFGHRDLAANKPEVYPDTYCPQNPEVYKLYFDVLDEYIEVIHPAMIHVGHDEWRTDITECTDCPIDDYAPMYAADLKKIHDHLAQKGIKVTIWGDHLMESVRGKGLREWKTSTGYTYKLPGALSAQQVKDLIPKDILVLNWFWDDRYDRNCDSLISGWGFTQAYGNMRADMNHWDERIKVKGMVGGEPSSWAGTTELNFGKDQLVNFLGCANLLWSEHQLSFDTLVFTLEPLVHDIYRDLSGSVLPSDDGCTVRALDISSDFNSSLSGGIESLHAGDLATGKITSGNRFFQLAGPSTNGKRAIAAVTAKDQTGIPAPGAFTLNEDVSSIIFLHACAKNAANRKAYYDMYNFDDTADLLGWYEVVYEDGFIETIPIRYGVNILDWGWRQRIVKNEKETIHYNQDKHAYEADAVRCSKDAAETITFFSYEWRNPRFGKKISEVRLRAATYQKNNENAVVLLSVSVAEKMDILPELIKSR